MEITIVMVTRGCGPDSSKPMPFAPRVWSSFWEALSQLRIRREELKVHLKMSRRNYENDSWRHMGAPDFSRTFLCDPNMKTLGHFDRIVMDYEIVDCRDGITYCDSQTGISFKNELKERLEYHLGPYVEEDWPIYPVGYM